MTTGVPDARRRRAAALLPLPAIGTAWLGCAVLVAVGLGIAAAAAPVVASALPPQALLGDWLVASRDGILQISRASDGTYQGRIVGGTDPGRLDSHNPDPARRQDRLKGAVILTGLRYVGHDQWTGGLIYDPDDGHSYHCVIELLGRDRLRLRGYLGIPLFGRTQIWTRYRPASR